MIGKKDPIIKTWLKILEERGTKHRWLAKKCGISPGHISNLLAGRVLLTDENKEKINKALGLETKNKENAN